MKRIEIGWAPMGEWVAARANCPWMPGKDIVAGIVDDSVDPSSPGYIRGGVIFANYTGTAMWLHVAGDDGNWLTRDFLWFVFDYTFRQLNCSHLYGIVEVANHHTLAFDLKVGFKVIATLDGLFPSGNGVIVGMRRDECRWLALTPRTIRANS